MSAVEATVEESEQDPHARSAAAQGSVVPLNFTPTPEKPLPVIRCTQIKKDGVRCGRWSLRGYHKCVKHAGPGVMEGGNVNVYIQKVTEAARLRLIDSSDDAIDVLYDLWSNPGTADAIKLKAATEVLDRAGIRGGFEVDVDVVVHESPVDEIKKRLAELRKGAEAVGRIQDGDIVEGEIIEDDEQLALFPLDDEDEEDADS